MELSNKSQINVSVPKDVMLAQIEESEHTVGGKSRMRLILRMHTYGKKLSRDECLLIGNILTTINDFSRYAAISFFLWGNEDDVGVVSADACVEFNSWSGDEEGNGMRIEFYRW
jgi:hypothetical protein